MLTFVLTVVQAVAMAYATAQAQAILTVPWRNGVSWPGQAGQSKGFHWWNAVAVLSLAVGRSATVGVFTSSWPAVVVTLVVVLAVWSAVFDAAYATACRLPWDYLGTTAATDRLWRRLAPRHPGRTKAIVMTAVVAVCAAVYALKVH